MKVKSLLACIVCIFLVTGCEEKKPSVCTTVYPVQYLVQRIGGKYVTSTNISSNTLIQRAQIKKNYKNIVKHADILFYIGGLEPYMDIYMDEVRNTNIDMVNLATKSAIYKFDRYTTTQVNGKRTGSAGPYYAGDTFSSINTYDTDPMLWMDPVAMTSMASDIRDALVEQYPEYKTIFNDNYNAVELDLARLDSDFQAIPDNKMNIRFVSMTPSFGIWQRSYGIQVYPITLSKYGALPTKDQLAAIKKRIIKDQVRYIAIEQNLPKDMETLQNELIQELGLVPVQLNNLSSITKQDVDAGKDYLSIMYENLQTLKSMNQ